MKLVKIWLWSSWTNFSPGGALYIHHWLYISNGFNQIFINLIRQELETKIWMKLSKIFFGYLVFADEKKFPPRHPLQRLNRLVEFSNEILNSDEFKRQSGKSFDWINMWSRKFSINADRMKQSFTRDGQRCGFYNEE